MSKVFNQETVWCEHCHAWMTWDEFVAHNNNRECAKFND